MYTIVPYLTAHRILSPSGKMVEQHADLSVAEARCAALNAKRPAPKASPIATAEDTAVEQKAPTGDADLSVLSLSLAEMAGELASGAHDDYLGALLQGEQDGKARKGAISMIQDRIDSLSS